MACHKDTEPRQNLILKNALNGRFFISLLILLCSFNTHATSLSNKCVSTHYDEQSRLDYVIDGDTVVLKDKRHIRLIGINTPEISHNDSPSEPGAEIAKNRLIGLLGKNKTVFLLYDQERKDRHGRTLAHIYLPDGENVQAILLTEGLAMQLIIPPSLLMLECYTLAAEQARKDKKGLWALPDYQPIHVDKLSSKITGFHFITGKVTDVTESRSSIWINLENNVALRIVKDDLRYFDEKELFKLTGDRLEANGWLYKRNGQLRMRIRHSKNITVVSDN